jgi:hypothetical protein
MANVTVADVLTRLRALMAAYSPALGTDLSDGAPVVSLPAYYVEAGEATREGVRGRRLVSRQYIITVYVSQIARIDDRVETEAAKTACYVWIDPLANYLSGKPRLELDDAHPALVHGIGEVSDTGAAVFPPLQNKSYAAFALVVTIVTAQV